jgi:hypothetical protein
MRSDGAATNIYTDASVFTNTASAVRRLTVESQGSGGTPYVTLKARNTTQASMYLTNGGFYIASETSGVGLNLQVNNGGTTITPLQCYANGVTTVGNSTTGNKILALFDTSSSDTPSSATAFYGFGVNSSTLRYQVPQSTHSHKFYTGTTVAYTITSAGGANGSDSRWKTDVQSLTGSLAKISQLQGKSFILNGDPKRQIGFIAQEVKEVVPEVVVVDEGEEHYHFMQYDRLTALLCEGIKELLARVEVLEAKVQALESP